MVADISNDKLTTLQNPLPACSRNRSRNIWPVIVCMMLLGIESTALAQSGGAVGFAPGAGGTHSSMPGSAIPSAGEKATLALTKPTTLTGETRPFNELAAVFKQETGILMSLDRNALDGEGIAIEVEIPGEAEGLSWGEALDLLLPDVALDFVVVGDVVRITTSERAKSMFSVQVYDVGDLLTEGLHGEPGAFTEESLVRCLQSSIPSGKWTVTDQEGGALQLVDGILVVSQHRRGQAVIAKILSQLNAVRQARKARDATNQMPVVAYRIYAPDVVQSDEGNHPAFLSGAMNWLNWFPFGNTFGNTSGSKSVGGASAESGKASNPVNLPTEPGPGFVLSAIEGGSVRSQSFATDLAKLIPTVVAPESWKAENGAGTIHGLPGVLIVKQTPAVHRQIRSLLRPFLRSPRDNSKSTPMMGGFGGGGASSGSSGGVGGGYF